MAVSVNDSRHDEAACGIDDGCSGFGLKFGSDGDDCATLHKDRGFRERQSGGREDGSVFDQDVATRGDRSRKLPIGVATRINAPLTSPP